jgi:dipeptidyl aminopeptidase/acylaminoacyl peptidase
MIKKTLLTTITIALLTSCSFNKAFFKPTKISATAIKATIKTATDTTVFSFAGANYQPTLTQKNGKPADLDYTIESVIFKSANGNKLNGWLLKPKNVVPTITLLHLHGNEGALLNQYQAISPLLKNGFQIFVFDYSGFGFSEGKATRENILIDALSAFDYIKSRQEVVNTKLVIYGQSIGGHLSAVVATQRQQAVDGLVIEGGFSSYKDIAGQKVPLLGKLFSKQGYSATKSIKNFHKPLLVIHSTEDKEVPFYMGKKIFDNANVPKEFYEIKNCHICGPTFYPDEISTKIKRMLELK